MDKVEAQMTFTQIALENNDKLKLWPFNLNLGLKNCSHITHLGRGIGRGAVKGGGS